ncbi:MAG: hypothetical protein J6I56_09635 [Lachnospiraceae bacterium]|nr:hypothetical protein [Lachnospiraceae bacterium]
MDIRITGTKEEIREFVEELKPYYLLFARLSDHGDTERGDKYVVYKEVEALRGKKFHASLWLNLGRVPRKDARWEKSIFYDSWHDEYGESAPQPFDWYECEFSDTEYDPEKAKQLKQLWELPSWWEGYDGRPWWNEDGRPLWEKDEEDDMHQ